MLPETGEVGVSLHNAHVLFDDDRRGLPRIVSIEATGVVVKWVSVQHVLKGPPLLLMAAMGFTRDLIEKADGRCLQFALVDLDWVPLG